MRTVIISDIHLGPHDIYAGGSALPSLLSAGRDPKRIILNGDTFDFLQNDDPLELALERAVVQLDNILKIPTVRDVVKALGRVLHDDGEVWLRPGNHDLELCLPQVQDRLREALGQPSDVASRLHVVRGDEPSRFVERSRRFLVTHGEANDPFNEVAYDRLPPSTERFQYPPGSLLVKRILNPLKSQHHMRFIDLLKPDFQGAALAALAVAPAAVRLVFQEASLSILWQLFGNWLHGLPFAPGVAAGPDLGLSPRVAEAALAPDEQAALRAWLAGPLSFAPGLPGGLTERALQKLGRAGLRLYAEWHRTVAGEAGQAYFQLDPDAAELKQARDLGRAGQADVVITGHTHAARFHQDPELLYVNSGTWIGLMRLPSPEASDDEWAAWLGELRAHPMLDGPGNKVHIEHRPTAVVVNSGDHGVTVQLVLCQEDGATLPLAEAHL